LVEVTWILVQKRWQDRPANHDVGKAIGSGDSKPLAEPLHALLEVWAVCRLAYAGKVIEERSRSSNGKPVGCRNIRQ
jgi:hypothetical protein